MKNRAKHLATSESGPEVTVESANANCAEPAEREAVLKASEDESSPAEAVDRDAPADATDQAASRHEKSSPTHTALAVIDQANAIDRIPVNSVTDYIEQEKFSQTRLDRLYARWDERDGAFWVEYAVRCELVYEIHKETAKPGCRGGFSAALRRIKLAATTAYDMVRRHAITIEEAEDPDAYDPRDDEEEGEEDSRGEEQDDTARESTSSSNRNRGGRRGTGSRPKTAVITLSGSIAEAVNDIQTFYHKANAKEAIQFCVLRVWNELKMPLAKRTEELADPSLEADKPKRESLMLDDDFLDETDSIDGKPVVTAELPAHVPSADIAGGLSGAA